MKQILTVVLAVMAFISAGAYKYNYTFNNTPISEAIVTISKDNPDVNISFIYKDLNNYSTSAKIRTNDIHDALHTIVGLNPISIIKKDGNYYIEALQHGKYCYKGRLIDSDKEPVVGATVMLLAPKDSTVITYGITDAAGRFSIPCDKAGVIGKLSCIGYKTTLRRFNSFSVGTIVMPEHVRALKGITVEADNVLLYSDKSVYIPTSRQKNSSQTALDLIMRMAIPQLRPGGTETNSGQAVEYFIDFLPATSADLAGMRTEDVKRVEYYDYPSDPRFMGNAHVVNFIMQKYEYGGYVKGLLYDNFVISRQYNAYAKFQYKKMTFDWAGGMFFRNNKNAYQNSYETFRLPQEDGEIKDFTRNSIVDHCKEKDNTYWSSFKALYQTDKMVISNLVAINFDHRPVHLTEGHVTYAPEYIESSDYTSQNKSDVNSFAYHGYWYFMLPHNNYLVITPRYTYTHTSQHSTYVETGFNPVVNGAIDNSQQATGNISFAHIFDKAGTLKVVCNGDFIRHNTRYSGSSDLTDVARSYRLRPGVNYSFSNEKLYTDIGFGVYCDRSAYGSTTEIACSPWANCSFQYAFNRKNSAEINLSYKMWAPSPNYRSSAIIEAYPLMRYTGNPSLVPDDSYSADLSYTWIPNNKFSFSTYGGAWIVGNRYVYDYEAFPDGILRTIKQPLGKYIQGDYGLNGSAKLLDEKLYLGLGCSVQHTHNGAPYHWTKVSPRIWASAYYYLGNVYLGADYTSRFGNADGCMDGIWVTYNDRYSFQIGWGNKHWNVRFYTANFFKHHAYWTYEQMNSRYYGCTTYKYSSGSALFQISATYTLGFGKKVKAENEAYQASGTSSGILK